MSSSNNAGEGPSGPTVEGRDERMHAFIRKYLDPNWTVPPSELRKFNDVYCSLLKAPTDAAVFEEDMDHLEALLPQMEKKTGVYQNLLTMLGMSKLGQVKTLRKQVQGHVRRSKANEGFVRATHHANAEHDTYRAFQATLEDPADLKTLCQMEKSQTSSATPGGKPKKVKNNTLIGKTLSKYTRYSAFRKSIGGKEKQYFKKVDQSNFWQAKQALLDEAFRPTTSSSTMSSSSSAGSVDESGYPHGPSNPEMSSSQTSLIDGVPSVEVVARVRRTVALGAMLEQSPCYKVMKGLNQHARKVKNGTADETEITAKEAEECAEAIANAAQMYGTR